MLPAIGYIVSTAIWLGASETAVQVISTILATLMINQATSMVNEAIRGKPKGNAGRRVNVR